MPVVEKVIEPLAMRLVNYGALINPAARTGILRGGGRVNLVKRASAARPQAEARPFIPHRALSIRLLNQQNRPRLILHH